MAILQPQLQRNCTKPLHQPLHLRPQGYLKPLNQSAYWLGLQASDASWPTFRPLDPTAAPAGGAGGSYQLWGLSAPSGKAEPKSRLELCAAANATITGYPDQDPWSWSGAMCSRRLPFVCRQQQPGQWSFKAPSSSMGALAAGAAAAAGAGTNTYVLNTSRVPFDVAQAWCNDMGEQPGRCRQGPASCWDRAMHSSQGWLRTAAADAWRCCCRCLRWQPHWI